MSQPIVELKPCPYCGGQASASTSLTFCEKGKVTTYVSAVYCTSYGCGARIDASRDNGVEDAVEAWNRRSKENE